MQSDKLIEVTSQSYIAFFAILYSSIYLFTIAWYHRPLWVRSAPPQVCCSACPASSLRALLFDWFNCYLCSEGYLHMRAAQSASTLIGISVCLFSLCDTSLHQICESNTYNLHNLMELWTEEYSASVGSYWGYSSSPAVVRIRRTRLDSNSHQ